MKILLDLQGLQSESRSRGIGRLTRMLALAMIAGTDRHRFEILLSEDLDADLDGVVAAFQAVLPPGRIHTVGPYGRVAEHVAGSAWRARAAALLREAKIAALRPDLVHVGSLFEGFVDDAVLSVGRMRAEHRTAVTLYDLIPLADPERYLADPLPAQFYLRHVLDLKRADLLLSISEHSKTEASRLLGIPPDRIAVMYAGVSPVFRPLGLGPDQEAGLRRRFGIAGPFLLFVGATDPRKNVGTFLEGFARLPARLRADRTIVFAGKLSDDERLAVLASARHWSIPDGQVVFTGFVEDPDLVALYNLCEAMIFPSSHEGFGLPPAEAMACGAPVLAADRTSLPEVLGRSDCLFDPFDAGSLAGRLERVLTDVGWRAELRDWGLRARRASRGPRRPAGRSRPSTRCRPGPSPARPPRSRASAADPGWPSCRRCRPTRPGSRTTARSSCASSWSITTSTASTRREDVRRLDRCELRASDDRVVRGPRRRLRPHPVLGRQFDLPRPRVRAPGPVSGHGDPARRLPVRPCDRPRPAFRRSRAGIFGPSSTARTASPASG